MTRGIYRDRPGAADLAPATGAPAIDLGQDIWMSPGVSNAYALGTDDGRVIVNAGLVFEGPLRRRPLMRRARVRRGPSSSPRDTPITGVG